MNTPLARLTAHTGADRLQAERLLFLDDHSIAETRHLIRRFHAASKQGGRPLIVPDLPWERSMGHSFGTVMYEHGIFRYWYQVYTMPSPTTGTFHCGYAESTDGFTWIKPELGLIEWEGSRANNLVHSDVAWVNVIKDEHDPDPSRRYKMLYFGNGKPKPGALPKWMGMDGSWAWCVSFSPDGLRWSASPDNPVYAGAKDGGTLFGWDERIGQYVAFYLPCVWWPQDAGRDDDYNALLQGWYDGGAVPIDEGMKRFPGERLIGRATSDDFLRWGPTRTIIARDELDAPATEFYGLAAFRYQGYYVGLLYMLYCDPAEPPIRKKGLMDTQLVASRDGISWMRMGGRQPFIARGAPGSWDLGMVGPNNGLVEKDGKLWFFYNGWTGEHRETKAYRRADAPGLWEMGRLTSGTGLAWLRQDGFVSLDAGEDEGMLATHPEQLAGHDLLINATTAGRGGYVAAEVVGPGGSPIEGYSVADCDRFDAVHFGGDSVAHVLTWRGASLATLPAGTYSIRFRLRLASLYSYAV